MGDERLRDRIRTAAAGNDGASWLKAGQELLRVGELRRAALAAFRAAVTNADPDGVTALQDALTPDIDQFQAGARVRIAAHGFAWSAADDSPTFAIRNHALVRLDGGRAVAVQGSPKDVLDVVPELDGHSVLVGAWRLDLASGRRSALPAGVAPRVAVGERILATTGGTGAGRTGVHLVLLDGVSDRTWELELPWVGSSSIAPTGAVVTCRQRELSFYRPFEAKPWAVTPLPTKGRDAGVLAAGSRVVVLAGGELILLQASGEVLGRAPFPGRYALGDFSTCRGGPTAAERGELLRPVAVHPSGRLVAVPGRFGELVLLDLVSGRSRRVKVGHDADEFVWSPEIVWSPCGLRLVAATSDSFTVLDATGAPSADARAPRSAPARRPARPVARRRRARATARG